MGIISKKYIQTVVPRFNKQKGIPYYSYSDFKGFHMESFFFTNSLGIEIKYFFYYYDNYKKDKIVLFCHGIGPGHTAYLKEIEEMAKRGYKVLTLDYEGCEESKGDNLRSLNAPSRDVIDLINYLSLKEEIVLMGHSLGGHTVLNVASVRDDIHKVISMSPFLSIKSLFQTMIKSKFVLSRILRYEKKQEPDFFKIDLVNYLKVTNDNVLFIQSMDDQIIPSRISIEVAETIDNPHLSIIKVNNRKHNPNYTLEAVNYMNDVFGKYNELLNQGKMNLDEERIDFFKNVSLPKLVSQDQEMFDKICEFIEK